MNPLFDQMRLTTLMSQLLKHYPEPQALAIIQRAFESACRRQDLSQIKNKVSQP